jgi:hypothetical protein
MAPESNKQPAPLFDSLPYYDNDLETHPILREKVQHEVAVETQKIQQEALHPRVASPIDLFVVSLSNEQSQLLQTLSALQNNPLLASELERVGARQPLAAIDTSRYQLTPSSATPSSDEEWKSALDGVYALLEHQRIRYSNLYSQCDIPLISLSRHNNLALLQQYGNNAWRVHNYLLEADTKKAENVLEELKERTTGLNRERKNTQVHVHHNLRQTRC